MSEVFLTWAAGVFVRRQSDTSDGWIGTRFPRDRARPGRIRSINVVGHTGTEEETTGAAQSAKMVTSQCGRYGHQSMWS